MRSADARKAGRACDDHIVRTAGAVDDQQISIGVPSADDTDMGVTWVEHKVARQRLAPCDRRTIAVLTGRSTAMTDDIAAAGCVVKCPIGKTGAVKSEWAVSASGRAAVRNDLHRGAPAGIPAEDKALDSDR